MTGKRLWIRCDVCNANIWARTLFKLFNLLSYFARYNFKKKLCYFRDNDNTILVAVKDVMDEHKIPVNELRDSHCLYLSIYDIYIYIYIYLWVRPSVRPCFCVPAMNTIHFAVSSCWFQAVLRSRSWSAGERCSCWRWCWYQDIYWGWWRQQSWATCAGHGPRRYYWEASEANYEGQRVRVHLHVPTKQARSLHRQHHLFIKSDPEESIQSWSRPYEDQQDQGTWTGIRNRNCWTASQVRCGAERRTWNTGLVIYNI